jgi:hypothetical protein
MATWERLAHTKLSSSGATIDTGTFTAKKNLKVEIYTLSASVDHYPYMRFNGDSDSNYAYRKNAMEIPDGNTNVNLVYADLYVSGRNGFYVMDITNIADQEKLVIMHNVGGNTGAGNAPLRREYVHKWDNKSDQITQITVHHGNGSNTFDADSYITVWGASDNSTSDEKTTLSDIPANTRYEETDTRKIYRFKASDTLEQLNGDGNRTVFTHGGNEAHYGIKINTGSDLIGKVISKVHFKIKQNENPSTENLVYVRLWRGSSFVHTFGTTDPDNIAIGTYTYYSFGTGGDFSTSSDGNATLQAGDRIVLSWDRGGAYNNTYIHMQYSNTSQYEGTSVAMSQTASPTQESHWNDNASRDVAFKLEGTSGSGLGNKWIERGTA